MDDEKNPVVHSDHCNLVTCYCWENQDVLYIKNNQWKVLWGVDELELCCWI